MSETMEWGNDRTSRLDRFVTGRRLSTVVVTGALVGLGVALLCAAELLPWATRKGGPISNDVDLPIAAGSEFRLAEFNTWEVFGYHLGWLALLTLAAAAVAARPAARRSLGAAALGAAGGVLVQLLGLVRSAEDGSALIPSALFETQQDLGTSLASGAYCAIAALLVVAAAIVVSLGLRLPRRRQPETMPEAEYEPAPDVTVSVS
jgi:hypothetical protein